MKTYTYTVSSQSVTGSLTWNANGTLGSLLITDAFHSVNTQNCAYTHDDLVRIASVNCGASTWQQNFTYDPFGNITKTVPAGGTGISFQPTYSATSNHIATVGSFTPTYDANGDVTNDGIHSYTWDAFGNAKTIDGITIIYDALDRMVEQQRPGNNNSEIIYSPTGFKMQIMNGATSNFSFVPLPAGGSVVYTPGGTYYRHADWLGSSRFASTTSRTVLYDGAYAPFGEPYAQTGSPDLSFTGMNTDTSSGLYDFLYREYSTQGRWPRPDPAGLGAANPSNPQTWNRYAYVSNSPLSLVDPLGLCQKSKSGFNVNCGASGIGDGGGCSMDGDTVDCVGIGTMGDPTAVIGGNSVFDAIGRAPGTSFNPQNGGWGWSAPSPSSWAARSGIASPPANETVYVYCSEFDLSNISCDPPPQAAGSRTWYSPGYNADEARLASIGRGVVRLAEGPINVMSAAFVVETLGIGSVEIDPAIVPFAINVNATATVAAETYIGWRVIYQFASGFTSGTRAPNSPAGWLGYAAGDFFRNLTRP